MLQPLRLILDTNVVLDWLVFDHSETRVLDAHVRSGAVVVLAHPSLHDEFARVLHYRTLKLAESRRIEVLARYRECTVAVFKSEEVPSGLPAQFPRCRDPDDQIFLALAYQTRCDALVTRDKVVLKMRKRMRKFGVTILDVKGMNEQLASARSGDNEVRVDLGAPGGESAFEMRNR